MSGVRVTFLVPLRINQRPSGSGGALSGVRVTFLVPLRINQHPSGNGGTLSGVRVTFVVPLTIRLCLVVGHQLAGRPYCCVMDL